MRYSPAQNIQNGRFCVVHHHILGRSNMTNFPDTIISIPLILDSVEGFSCAYVFFFYIFE